jgi:ATP synthase protein I
VKIMAEPDTPSEADPLDALRRKVDAAQKDRAARTAANEAAPSAASLAMRISGVFGAAILVGAGIGYGIDVLAKTKPWGLTIGLSLGFAAAIVNVVRAVRTYNAEHPVDPNAPRIEDEDEK